MEWCPACGRSLTVEVVHTTESIAVINRQAAKIDVMQKEIDRLVKELAGAKHLIAHLQENEHDERER